MLSLETFLVLPVIVVAFGLLAQASWIGFQTACFDHAVNAAAWSMEPDASSADAARTVRDAIVSDWTPLADDRVSVVEASVSSETRTTTTLASGPLDHDFYLVERTASSELSVRTTARVAYRIPSIVMLPGFSEVTIERRLDRTFLQRSRFEVS